MENMIGVVQTTEVDCDVVLWMWCRITLPRRILRLPRAWSVKSTDLRRMTDFDDVTFQEQFRFTKTEFLDILSTMEDKNGVHGFPTTVCCLSMTLSKRRMDIHTKLWFFRMVCVLLPFYCFVSPSHSNL